MTTTRLLYGDGILRHPVHRTLPATQWAAADTADVPVGYRRLLHRVFDTLYGQAVCVEYVLTRLTHLEDSHDTVVFLEGGVPPLRWHARIPWEGTDEEEARRHSVQDALSWTPFME